MFETQWIVAGVGGIVAALAALQGLLRPMDKLSHRRRITLRTLVVGVCLLQWGLHAAQSYNVVVAEREEKKRFEREMAIALWAYTDHQKEALRILTADYPYILAYYRFKRGEFDAARLKLDQAIDRDHFTAPAYYIRAVLNRIEGGDPATSLELVEKGVAYDPQFSSLYIERAILRIGRGEVEEAVEDAARAVVLSEVHCLSVNNAELWDAALGHPGFEDLRRSCAGFGSRRPMSPALPTP